MSDFFNFADAPTEQMGGNELIPAKTLAWAILTVRPASPHQVETISKSNPANAYLDCELTICEGQYTKRKLWDMIGVKGAQDEKGQKYVNGGRASIRAILEAGRNASPQNPAGYQISSFMDLNGLKVAVEIGIEKGTNGYQDKNRVTAYLSPNPQSSTHKKFAELSGAGSVGNVGQVAPVAPAQAPAPAQQTGGAPSWLQQ